jgi:hypothetical protein
MSTARQCPRKETPGHAVEPAGERLWFPTRTWALLSVWLAPLAFTVVALAPVIKRLRHPTILGDDVTRIVDLSNLPFGKFLFLPFGDHVAPGFQLVSWITWKAIGHDLRLTPLGFTIASVTAWVLVLALLWVWLKRETGSRTASLVALALVAQSPLVLETAWWYSSSSFSWAVAGILIAVLGATWIAQRPRRSLFLIGIGSALGPAGTTLGILAVPLAILRAALQPAATRTVKLLAAVAAVAGFFAYEEFSRLGGVEAVRTARVQGLPKVDPLGGLGYAASVPGRLLVPSTFGVPASRLVMPLPSWIVRGAGALTLLAAAVLTSWPHARWDRRLLFIGAAMIYSSYMLTYSSRMSMMKEGLWTEPDFLYNFAGRYHVLPSLGLAAIVAALLASWPLVRRCDSRRGVPAMIGTLVGLLMFTLQHAEATRWDWMLCQPDQRETLSAVHRVGEIARAEGVSRPQLLRIFDPAWRSWNGSLVHDCPPAFHLMNLAVQADDHLNHALDDGQARSRLLAQLSEQEIVALGSGTCSFLRPAQLEPMARIIAIARRVEIHEAFEWKEGRFRSRNWPSYIEFEFDATADGRYLLLPGLTADQDLVVSCCGSSGRWRPGLNLRWLRSEGNDSTAAIDLDRLIHWPAKSVSRIRVAFTRPGELALDGPPRLLR